jgi:hypothetical protein
MPPQEAHRRINGHPIDAGTALIGTHAFPRYFDVRSIAHLLHQTFFFGQAFACWFRHQWFGPFGVGDGGVTPPFLPKGQEQLLALDFRPLSTHELPVLLTTPNRSGLRPSFPARPICLLRLSALECLTCLADGRDYYALC